MGARVVEEVGAAHRVHRRLRHLWVRPGIHPDRHTVLLRCVQDGREIRELPQWVCPNKNAKKAGRAVGEDAIHDDFKPSIVVIRLGGNDVLFPKASVESFARSFQGLVKDVRTYRPDAIIVAVTVAARFASACDTAEDKRMDWEQQRAYHDAAFHGLKETKSGPVTPEIPPLDDERAHWVHLDPGSRHSGLISKYVVSVLEAHIDPEVARKVGIAASVGIVNVTSSAALKNTLTAHKESLSTVLLQQGVSDADIKTMRSMPMAGTVPALEVEEAGSFTRSKGESQESTVKVLVDTTGDGTYDSVVSGVDTTGEGVPDLLQDLIAAKDNQAQLDLKYDSCASHEELSGPEVEGILQFLEQLETEGDVGMWDENSRKFAGMMHWSAEGHFAVACMLIHELRRISGWKPVCSAGNIPTIKSNFLNQPLEGQTGWDEDKTFIPSEEYMQSVGLLGITTPVTPFGVRCLTQDKHIFTEKPTDHPPANSTGVESCESVYL